MCVYVIARKAEGGMKASSKEWKITRERREGCRRGCVSTAAAADASGVRATRDVRSDYVNEVGASPSDVARFCQNS